MSRKPTSPEKRPRRPGVTVVGHDDSTVTAFHHGGNMDITSHDRCSVTLFQGESGSNQGPDIVQIPASSKIDWTKWGTIFGAIGVLATILVAVLF